jgi:hypothetical protein
MNRFSLFCFALLLSTGWPASAQDDDPFGAGHETSGGVGIRTSALEDAVSLVAAEPALVNETHEKLYKGYAAAVTATDTAFAAKEKALCASIAAELDKTKGGLDAAGAQSATAAITAVKTGDATLLAPKAGDPAALAVAKRRQLGRFQRLRAAHGLAHADHIRDYVVSLDKLQRSLAASSQLGDAVFIATEARGLRKLLASGGSGGRPLSAFQFEALPIKSARTPIPSFHSGIPILSALGGDFSESSAFLALRPPAPETGTEGQWELRGGDVPDNASGGLTLMEAPLIDFAGAEISTREWRGGGVSAPIKLLPASEGFCMIGGLRGPFPSGSEARVAINPTDQHWYLSGKGGTPETAVSAIIVRFPNASERPALLPKTFSWGSQAPHVRMLESTTSFCAFTRLAGPIESRKTSLSLTIAPDGFWYLQGRADTASTAAEATAFTLKPAS